MSELEAEVARLRLKVEQYQRQLDDGWAGVTALVNATVEENTRLKALLRTVEPNLSHTMRCRVHFYARADSEGLPANRNNWIDWCTCHVKQIRDALSGS